MISGTVVRGSPVSPRSLHLPLVLALITAPLGAQHRPGAHSGGRPRASHRVTHVLRWRATRSIVTSYAAGVWHGRTTGGASVRRQHRLVKRALRTYGCAPDKHRQAGEGDPHGFGASGAFGGRMGRAGRSSPGPGVTGMGRTRPAATAPPRHARRPGGVGRLMELLLPDGAWCLFSGPVEGSRQGKIVLVEHRDIHDPETGGSSPSSATGAAKPLTPRAGGTWRSASPPRTRSSRPWFSAKVTRARCASWPNWSRCSRYAPAGRRA